MIGEPKITQIISSPNSILVAIRAYINLITKNEPLVPGPGVNKIYAIMSGSSSLWNEDVNAIAAKSERDGLIPKNMTSVMNFCILKNCKIYGDVLVDLINDRILAISNGDVINPDPTLHYNVISARRYYYTPTIALVKTIRRAILNNAYRNPWEKNPDEGGCTLTDACNDAMMLLKQMEMNEGRIYPNQTSYGALSNIVQELKAVLSDSNNYISDNLDYISKVRPALTILWVIAKLLYGDLSTNPMPKDINLVDVSSGIQLSDGTLASIPFPTKETIYIFSSQNEESLSIKGRAYLAAVSGAAFYKGSRNKMYDE
jgi:hypothetical protein